MPGGVTNLTAFFDVKTNLADTNWQRITLPYPLQGGELRVPWTGDCAYFRAGFSWAN